MQIKVYTVDFEFPRWLKRSLLFAGIPIAILLGVGAAVKAAGALSNVSIVSFASGETLSADKMNANFGNLVTGINNLNTAVNALQGAAATDVNCPGCVGTGDLANGAVTVAKLGISITRKVVETKFTVPASVNSNIHDPPILTDGNYIMPITQYADCGAGWTIVGVACRDNSTDDAVGTSYWPPLVLVSAVISSLPGDERAYCSYNNYSSLPHSASTFANCIKLQ
jgi:hypothetical protein